MDNQNIRTAMTATTGMSRLQFVHGQTIHHWSGYGDGHVDKIQLLKEYSIMQPTRISNQTLSVSKTKEFQLFLGQC